MAGAGKGPQDTQKKIKAKNEDKIALEDKFTDLAAESKAEIEVVVPTDGRLPNAGNPKSVARVMDSAKTVKDREENPQDRSNPPEQTVVVRRFKPDYVTSDGKLRLNKLAKEIQKVQDWYLNKANNTSIDSSLKRAQYVGFAAGVSALINLFTDEVEVLTSQIDPDVDLDQD